MQRNMLTGSIPAEIGNYSSLGDVDLSYNNLNGTIPRSLGKLSGMNGILDLSHNNLTGTIPLEFENFMQLGTLQLSTNMLSGPIPKNIVHPYIYLTLQRMIFMVIFQQALEA